MSPPDKANVSPWHAGEIALQSRLGVAARMDAVGRHAIRDRMIEQHREFYPQLPFVVLGSVDRAGNAWATIRADRPGFMQAPDDEHLALSLVRDPTDPAEAGLDDGDAVGLLGIELTSRRRNRLNGTVRRQTRDGFAIEVEQSFGNCPKYIQVRTPDFVRDPHRVGVAAETTTRFDARARAIVEGADTFFVATYVDGENGRRQVDVSHRGGRPGFVRVGNDGRLVVPDFSGNRFFNTLGNIVANPRAGLIFVDFATGDLLQMTGRAEVLLDPAEIAVFEGAERLWRFEAEEIVFRAGALPLRFAFSEGGWSPHTLATGNWTRSAAGAAPKQPKKKPDPAEAGPG